MRLSDGPREAASSGPTRSGGHPGSGPVNGPPGRAPRYGSRPKCRQVALAGFATPTLQGIILLAAVALIFALLWCQRVARTKHPEPMDLFDRLREPRIAAGQVATPEGFHVERSSVEDVADPDRVKSVLRVGKTYEIRVKGGFTAALKERDYGVRRRENLAFAFEMLTRRTIESNDGRRIVAVLRFERVRMAKLLTAVEDFQIDLGAPGEPIFDGLDHLAPEAGIALVDVAPVADALLGRTARPVAQSPTSRAFLETDPLSGKTVRITYRTGQGVESIQPIGCTLDNRQARFVFQRALLSDYFLLPRRPAAVGETRRVDARQLMGYLEPSLRGLPEGEIAVRRGAEHRHNGKRYCTLQVQGDALNVRSCILPDGFFGRFRPTGTLQFNLSDGYVEGAQLRWRIDEAQFLFGDRLLFESDFRGQPRLAIDYRCKLG